MCAWIEGLERVVVGGVNPTHYKSCLWPILGTGLQGPNAASYQYVFPLFHLSKCPLTALWLTSLSQSFPLRLFVSVSSNYCRDRVYTCDKRWWWWCSLEACQEQKNAGSFCTERNYVERPRTTSAEYMKRMKCIFLNLLPCLHTVECNYILCVWWEHTLWMGDKEECNEIMDMMQQKAEWMILYLHYLYFQIKIWQFFFFTFQCFL